MNQPTKEQIDEFFSKATQEQLRDLLEYAEDEAVRKEAMKHYDFDKAEEWQLINLLKYAKDEAVIKEAQKYLGTDVFGYLKNK